MRIVPIHTICSALGRTIVCCGTLPPHNFSNFIQFRFVHHHRELDEPGGFERFIGWRRSNPAKANRNTHINERKFRKMRGAKTLLIDLGDEEMEERQRKGVKPDEMRMYLLRKGKPNIFEKVSMREWNEHQMTLSTFGQVVDQYVPPETSLMSRGGFKETFKDVKSLVLQKYSNLMNGERRIRKKIGFENFSKKTFHTLADEIYIAAFSALMKRDKQRLHELITEKAFADLWPIVENGSLIWKLVNFVEPSKVIVVRCADHPQKSGNDIAQITVRMHTNQILALYDKDGHLLLGSENEPKECLEYVVFENHVASSDGVWRFHDRVYPNWLPPKQQPVNRQKLVEDYKAKRKDEMPEEPVKLRMSFADKLKELDKRSKG